MKNLNILFFILLIFILLSTGCSSYSRYYYTPDEGAILALNEKNDMKFSFSTIGADESDAKNRNYALLMGYSPIKHLGIQSSFFNLKKIKKGDADYLASVAIGTYYFYPLKKKNGKAKLKYPKMKGMERGLLLDFYAGYGSGGIHNFYFTTTTSRTFFKYNKTFAQFGIHWQGRLIGFDYTFKLINLNFNKGDVYGYPLLSEIALSDINDIQQSDPFNFGEHSFKCHFGDKFVRIFASINAFAFSEQYEEIFIPSSFSLGFMIELDEIFKKKETIKKPLE